MVKFIIVDEAGEDCTATNPHWSTDFCNDCECPALNQGKITTKFEIQVCLFVIRLNRKMSLILT